MRLRTVSLFMVLMMAFTSLSFGGIQSVAEGTETKKAGEIDFYTDRWAIVPEGGQAPVVDGVMDDAAWEEAVRLEQLVTAYYREAAEPATVVDLVYDSEHLYFGLTYDYEAEEHALAYVQILIRPDASDEAFYQIPITIREPELPFSNNWGPGGELVPSYEFEVVEEAGLVTIEVAVPLADLHSGERQAGDAWQINIVNQHELNTEPLSSWMPIHTSSYSKTDTSASVAFTIPLAHEGRMGSVFLGQPITEFSEPEEVQFRYTGFTEKELSFLAADHPLDHMELIWQTPSGERTQLQPVLQGQDDDRVVISFEHPSPVENGMYQLYVQANEPDDEALFTVLSFDRNDLIVAGDSLFVYDYYEGEKTQLEAAPPSTRVQNILNIIPERIGFRFTGLPDQPHLHPDRNFSWSINNPDVMTSNHSDMTYPHEDYPEDKVMTVTNHKGETVEYPYYEDEEGRQYFLSAHKWWLQRNYAVSQTSSISSSDPLGAARLLYRFAEVYPGYVPVSDHIWQNFPVEASSGPAYPWWGGIWNRWSASELWDLRNLFIAFDRIKKTNAFELLSDEVGEDVERKIVEEMFRPSVEFARTFPIINHNMDYTKWVGLGEMSKATLDPSYIHEGVELLEDYTMNEYLFDGFYRETTLSYHNQSTDGINRAMDAYQGWTDPEGYISPRSGTRFDNLDMKDQFPALGKSAEIPQIMVYPDGKYYPTQDTWADGSSGNPNLEAGSFLLPASGYARLQRGLSEGVGAEPGIAYSFPDMNVVENSTHFELFPASGTLQFEAEDEGHHITFSFDVAATDTYRLDLKPFKAASYGKYDVAINGETITELDFYHTGSGPADPETLTTMELTAGTHEITFTNIGKAEASTNYKMGIIQLVLLDEAAKNEEEHQNTPMDTQQLYMNFDPKYGHDHFDPLNLGLFAEGQELLPDIGYSYTFYRQWATSTMGHNTVVVDGKDMTKSGAGARGGNIEVFSPVNDQIQVMRAHQENAYPGMEEYSREPWFIGFPDGRGRGYVLDLFRVSGGDRHEYTLHGDANRDAVFETDLELETYGDYLLPEGTEVRLPETAYDTGDAEGHYYGYIYIQDVQQAILEDDQYALTLVTEDNGEEQARMKITGVLDSGDHELFLGRSPSLRSTRVHGRTLDTNDEAVKYDMPKYVLRKDGDEIKSQFVTLLEPYKGENGSRVDQIERLPMDQFSEGDIAVAVTYGDITDIILSSSDESAPLVVGDMVLEGKMGMIRLQNGEVLDMHLIGGTRLAKGNTELTDAGAVEGTITDVLRQGNRDSYDAFVTDTPVSEELQGNYIVVTHPDGKTHGYEIKEVLREDGQSIIRTEGMDPGFSIHNDGTSAMNFYPFTEWQGTHTFRIENTASSAVSVPDMSVSELLETMAGYEDELADEVFRALRLHLTSVEHFEQQEDAERVVRHMEGFKPLLNHFADQEMLPSELYESLMDGTDAVIAKWQ